MDKKLLGFDIGLKHTGVAASHGPLATPLTTLKTEDYNQLLSAIAGLVNQHRPSQVVLGIPSRGVIKGRVSQLREDLERLGIRVTTIDETASTKLAQKKLKESGKSASKRQEREHMAVAAFLLQDYLDGLID